MEKLANLNERENLEPNSRKRKLPSDDRDETGSMLNGNISPDLVQKSNLIFIGSLPEVTITCTS